MLKTAHTHKTATTLPCYNLPCDVRTACSLVAKVDHWDPVGWWFKFRCRHNKF